MLRRNKFVLQLLRLFFGARENIVHRLGDIDFGGIHAPCDGGQSIEFTLHGELQRAGRELELFHQRRDDPFLLPE